MDASIGEGIIYTETGNTSVPKPELKTGTISAPTGGKTIFGVGIESGSLGVGDFIWFPTTFEGREIMSISSEHDRIGIKTPFSTAVPSLTPLYVIKSGKFIEVSIRNTTAVAATVNGSSFTNEDTFTHRKETGLKPYFVNGINSPLRISTIS